MRRYETIFIMKSELPDEEISGLIEQYLALIAKEKGFVVKVERWGRRRLAYEIDKHSRGYYVLVDYAGLAAAVMELERNLKIEDRVIKFMTIKKADHADLQALQNEKDALEQAAVASVAEPAAAEGALKITQPEAPSGSDNSPAGEEPAEQPKTPEETEEGGNVS